MKLIRSFLLAAALAVLGASAALAQSTCPYIATGAVLTAAQWNQCFANKNDNLGYVPVNRAGDIMLGKLTTQGSSSSSAGLNLPQGTAPASPANGDVWTTLSGMYVRINGITIGPLASASAGTYAATSPLTVTFPSGIVTYGIGTDPASKAALTALVNPATSVLPGTLPAFPGTSTTYFRGDGTYQTLNCSALSGSAASCSTDATNASNISSGTLPAARLTGSYTGITGLGTITAGTWNATTIGLAYGGTGADLSATGGTNQVVKQATLGGALSVGTINCAFLSDAAASCATDATNATNIASGTLAAARLPAFGSGDVSFASGGGAGTIAANAVTNAKSAQMAAVTLKGNPTNATANAQDFTISGLTQSVAPDVTNDMLLIWDSAAGTLKKINPNTIASAAVAGVASIDAKTGAFTTSNGITTVVNDIQLAAIAADSILANASGSSAVPAAVALTSCSASASAMTYNTTSHAFGCNTLVSSVAGQTGAITLGNGLTNSGASVLIDKATSANLEAGASNKVLTADNIYDSEVTITYAASQTFDFNTFLNGRVTLTGDITSLTCSNIKASQSGTITLVQDGTGSRTMVAGWCSQFRWTGGTRGVLSTTASAVDALFYSCVSTSICYVSLGKAQAN